MKDPLQRQATPYEILGIKFSAGREEINNSLIQAVAQKRDIAKCQESRNILVQPLEKALVDIFFYNEAFQKQIKPRVNEGELKDTLVANRMETALAWSNLQKRAFPHLAALHSLAVLWYWWALYEEEARLAELSNSPFIRIKGLPGMPFQGDYGRIWRTTIAAWAMLINSPVFLQQWARNSGNEALLDSGEIHQLGKQVEEKLINILQKQAENYVGIKLNGEEGSQVFRNYILLFQTELRTGRQFSGLRIQVDHGDKKIPIQCGKFILEQVGLLGKVQAQLKMILAQRPQDTELKNLLAALSNHAELVMLVENRKYKEAIEAIEALPSAQREEREAQELLAKACLEQGKQYFSLDQYDEALNIWQKGLKTGCSKDEITRELVDSCKKKATVLKKSDPQTAVDLLRDALLVVEDKELKKELKELYILIVADWAWDEYIRTNDLDKARKIIIELGLSLYPADLKLKEKLSFILNDAGVQEANKGNYNQACELFDEAIYYNPQNHKAKDNLKKVKNVLKMLDEPIDPPPPPPPTPPPPPPPPERASYLNALAIGLVEEGIKYENSGDLVMARLLYKEAFELLDEAKTLDPSNSTIQSNYIKVRKLMKRLDRPKLKLPKYAIMSVLFFIVLLIISRCG
jgi:tetratricopeptide (TPR) repeat protein